MRRRCPECGQPVKEENLAEHLARAHPSVPRRKYREMNVRPPSRGRAVAPWMPAVAILVAVAVGAGVFFALQRSTPEGPVGGGRFGADHTFWDFGPVPQRVVDHSFTFRNDGVGDLVLSGAWTSCGCTTARIVIGGQGSPEFGMHSNPAWTGRVPPLGTATVVVSYDALEHPDLYVGERSVFLRTDDPELPEVEFRIAVREG